MARSRLTEISEDLNTDSGSVLWSLVRGEQLEFPITMNFIENLPVLYSGSMVNPASRYTYEVVVVEALNTSTQEEPPTTVRSGGVTSTLNVRVPTYRGNWDAAQAYNKEEIVAYASKYYRLSTGSARTSATLPTSDSYWIETVLNKVFVQFPSTLGATWSVQSVGNISVYGFFEMRVTEPSDAIFQRTWKPVRGMLELLFSPTEAVTSPSNSTIV